MRIDADEVRKHVKSKASRVKCHLCRRGPLYFSDSLLRVEECVEIKSTGQRPTLLLVQFTCDNCSAVSFLHPLAAGLNVIWDEDPEHMIHYLK